MILTRSIKIDDVFNIMCIVEQQTLLPSFGCILLKGAASGTQNHMVHGKTSIFKDHYSFCLSAGAQLGLQFKT